MGFTRLNDALGKNLIINGSFDVWQRGIGPFVNTGYTADRFQITTGRTLTVDRIGGDSPSFSPNITTLRLEAANVVAAPPSFTSRILQKIEGYNARRINNKPFLISFNVKGNFTGTSSLALSNSDFSRSFVSRYNVTTDWTRVTIRVPAENMRAVSGWNLENGVGMTVSWNVECSPDFQTTNVDQWQNGTFFGHPDDTVFGDVAGRQIFFSDIVLHEGVEELPVSELMRDYGTELKLCFRYFEKIPSLSMIWFPDGSNGTRGAFSFAFKERKRAVPVWTGPSIAVDHINGTQISILQSVSMTQDGITNGVIDNPVSINFLFSQINDFWIDAEL